MPSLYITGWNAKASLISERLHVTWTEPDGDDPRQREIPLRDVERVVMVSTASLTPAAMAALLRRDIPISILGGGGRLLGSFLPPTPDHGASRLTQYQRTLDPGFSLKISGRIIVAKIYNQRRLLQRVSANRRAGGHTVSGQVPEALAALDRIMAAAGNADSIPSLRGFEGAASARYFSAWASLLPPGFPFERRSTRPPLNPVNAAISFGATLVYQEMSAFVSAHGLDPALGFLHGTENGRWSLALDLMEPFRPALIEALALDLFTHQIVNASHFESRKGGIYLGDGGRKKLILQYEKRMGRQFLSESAGHRTSLRQQMENQAIALKSALDDPDRFEPFLMN